jgi:DnaJ-class molecular chaperone
MSSFNKTDYYQILGVSRNASDDEIRSQYRILALKFHPDKVKSSLAKQMMILINEAYEILSDPQKRKEYDLKDSNESENIASKETQTTISKESVSDDKNSKSAKTEKIIPTMRIFGNKVFKVLEKIAKNYKANMINANSAFSYDTRINYSRIQKERENIHDDEDDFNDYEEPSSESRKHQRKKPHHKQRSSDKNYDSFFKNPDYDIEGFFRKW